MFVTAHLLLRFFTLAMMDAARLPITAIPQTIRMNVDCAIYVLVLSSIEIMYIRMPIGRNVNAMQEMPVASPHMIIVFSVFVKIRNIFYTAIEIHIC